MLKRFFNPAVLALTALLIGATLVSGAAAAEYDAVYTITDGSKQVMTQTLYFKGGNKIRMEMQTKDGAVKTITRLDKRVTWMLLDDQKMYMEQQFDPETWNQYNCDQTKVKKIGAEKVLNFNCSIYEYIDGDYTYHYWQAENTMVIVKTVMWEKGKEKFRMEAKEIHLRKQADALFEVPAGYQKFSMKLPGNIKLPK